MNLSNAEVGLVFYVFVALYALGLHKVVHVNLFFLGNVARSVPTPLHSTSLTVHLVI